MENENKALDIFQVTGNCRNCSTRFEYKLNAPPYERVYCSPECHYKFELLPIESDTKKIYKLRKQLNIAMKALRETAKYGIDSELYYKIQNAIKLVQEIADE